MNPLFNEWATRWNIPSAALYELSLIGRPELDQPRVTGDSEANTQQSIRLLAAQHRIPMWRNNSGAFFDTEMNRWIRFGLGNDSKKLNKVWKSSDLYGINTDGRLIACEVKHPGWTKPQNDRDRAQEAHINQVNACGGIGFFASSVSDFERKVLGK